MSLDATTWAWQVPDLKPQERFVLLALANFHNGETGLCCPSARRISDHTGLHPGHVRRLVHSMSSRGVFAIEHLSGRPNLYSLPVLMTPRLGARGVAHGSAGGSRNGARHNQEENQETIGADDSEAYAPSSAPGGSQVIRAAALREQRMTAAADCPYCDEEGWLWRDGQVLRCSHVPVRSGSVDAPVIHLAEKAGS